MFYMFYVCVFFMYFFLSNLYLYNTVLYVLFCMNKDIIIYNNISEHKTTKINDSHCKLEYKRS